MVKKALIAMSGGVDSSVAAYLTKESGAECIGATMKLYENKNSPTTCCSIEDTEDARAVADKLAMPFYVFNFKDDFRKHVMQHFVDSYMSGFTPNPCIDCNRYLKFDRFLKRAQEIECDYIVTGHYARREYDKQKGRYLLRKGLDSFKDQSYVLYTMTQEQLSRTQFPLGNLRKPQVRKIAEGQGFINAKKGESQDICFVENGDYAEFIKQYPGTKWEKGFFKDRQGNTVGQHRGIIHYTVGQRKGLGISASEPSYVCEICAKDNTVVIGREADLYSKFLEAKDINLIALEHIDRPLKVSAKIRYGHEEEGATLYPLSDGILHVEFDKPQRAITKGQAIVFYDGDILIGGGTIS